MQGECAQNFKPCVKCMLRSFGAFFYKLILLSCMYVTRYAFWVYSIAVFMQLGHETSSENTHRHFRAQLTAGNDVQGAFVNLLTCL
jgi:hypothetical protein